MRACRSALFAGVALALSLGAAGAEAQTIKSYFEFKKPKLTEVPGDVSLDASGASAPLSASGPVSLGFEGISQYDLATVGRPNFIPPDTMGAVGKSQYMEFANGAVAVFDKATGTRTSLVSDVGFWAAAGQTGANGDQRVMYNADANRWIALSFGANTKDIQIAVSNTSDALGSWQSTKFEGFGGFGFGATADYPTLALDKNAVYIGTNNFAPVVAGGANNFRGTTLDVIPLTSLFGAGAPTTTGMTQFNTPFNPGAGQVEDRGFAIQGVNSSSASTTGRVIAASLFDFDNMTYSVLNAGAPGASLTAAQFLGSEAFTSPNAGRQPSAAIPANRRVIDTLDERISSSVYEANGLLYFVHTVNDTADGVDFSVVRYYVVDTATNAIVDSGNIGGPGYDYYQGSIAVNAKGQVVIAYNRSGNQLVDLDGDGFSDGNITFMARTFATSPTGHLVQLGKELKLKVSLVDDYHNGSLFGAAAVGRQRWGDYSAVSLDPEDMSKFWVIGEFAREYNNAAGGHPGGTGGSRWGTFIAAIDYNTAAVPEPTSWALMILGMGLTGAVVRRRRQGLTACRAAVV